MAERTIRSCLSRAPLGLVEATEVQIPGADGDMTAMANHAPTITTLRPGVSAGFACWRDR